MDKVSVAAKPITNNPVLSAFFSGFVLSLLFLVWKWYKKIKSTEEEIKKWPPYISPCPDYWVQSSNGKHCWNPFPEISSYRDRVIKSGIEYAKSCTAPSCSTTKGAKKTAFEWACDAIEHEAGIPWEGACREYTRLLEEDEKRKAKTNN